MKRLTLTALAAAATAAGLAAQNKTLLFTGRYDMVSTEGGAAILDNIRGHDIAAVTPGAGATAWSMIPSTAIQAMAGDKDGDGSVSQLSGVVPYSSTAFNVCGPFVKWADKTNFSPSKVYWTVQVYGGTSGSVTVSANNQPVKLRPGDFVRFLPSGEVEFFITQDLIMKAAGTQTGAHGLGANCITQDKDGNLYYAPAYGITGTSTGPAGGMWLEKGLAGLPVYAYDAAIVAIDKADITYDAKGNVIDVKPASAKIVINEINNGPAQEPNIRNLCVNSGAKDDLGCPTDITFHMGGLDIDPNGGTFVDWSSVTRPNFIFTVVRSAFQACGSWKGTIHSTTTFQQQLGSIAVVNGVQMGSTTMADGSWLGLANGQTLGASPLLQGLCWVEGGYSVRAPHGLPDAAAGAHGGGLHGRHRPDGRPRGPGRGGALPDRGDQLRRRRAQGWPPRWHRRQRELPRLPVLLSAPRLDRLPRCSDRRQGAGELQLPAAQRPDAQGHQPRLAVRRLDAGYDPGLHAAGVDRVQLSA